MYPQKFVAGCQQVLVLGAVCAVLVPAANVVSLDIVREAPQSASTSASAPTVGSSRATSIVPIGTVDATVRQIALTAPAYGVRPTLATGGGRTATSAVFVPGAEDIAATQVADTATGTTTIVSEPQPVTGYGTVGVTWEHGENLSEDEISLQIRTQTDGTWGAWAELAYHDEHGPDAGTAEAAGARPGSDEALVGHVDQVQVKAEVAADAVPEDMTMSVIDPGKPASTQAEAPDIDTSGIGPTASLDEPSTEPSTDAGTETGAQLVGADTGEMSLAAGAVTKPAIYSRAQWGADEKLREKSAPSYGTIHGAFVHHTVNANDYTAAEVPGILRSIYAYHVKSKGWRDIGYNFLVDRFGRIWEGRFGGVDRPVVGAHTENYNDDSFAMSAIGNYDIAQPSQEIVGAFAKLFAWKLSLHGISAAATGATIEGKKFASPIMGHRDTKSTACPGKYLYARIPDIRRAAASLQKGWAFAPRDADLVGSAQPDIIARRASDGRGVIIPTTGASGFRGSVLSNGGRSSFLLSPDLTGDGHADVVAWNAQGDLAIRPGNGQGAFGKAVLQTKRAKGRNLVVALGDVTGDRRNDLAVRSTKTGRLTLLVGSGTGRFTARSVNLGSFAGFNWLSGGDVDGNGRADILGRDTRGGLSWWPGNGAGSFGARRSLGGGFQSASSLAAADFNGDGRTDLIVRSKSSKKGYVRLGTGTGFSGNLGPYSGFKNVGAILGATQVVGGASPEVLTTLGGRISLLLKKDSTDLGLPVTTNLDLRSANLVLNAGDWNGDRRGDVIYRATSGVLYLALGNGAGTFAGAYNLGNFGGYSLIAAVGDMTGDGLPDLMAQNSSGMRIFPGNGRTGVAASYPMYGRIAGTAQVSGGTWDADKAPDVLIRNGDALVLYRGNGPGGLASPRTVSTGMNAYDWVIGIGALAGTGHSDLVVRTKTGVLYALSGQADGSMGKRRVLGYGFGGYDLAG